MGAAVGVGAARERGPPGLLYSSLSSLEVDRLALPSPASSSSSSVSPVSFCLFPEFCSFSPEFPPAISRASDGMNV